MLKTYEPNVGIKKEVSAMVVDRTPKRKWKGPKGSNKKAKGKGEPNLDKGKQVKVHKPKGECHHCGKKGHWWRNSKDYLESLEKKKFGETSTSDLLTKDYNFDQKFTFTMTRAIGMLSAKVTVGDVLPSTKAVLSFKIPDHKSGKMDLKYLHHHAAIDSSIGLNPTPQLELSAAIGSNELCLGGEIGFDTASASFTKYIAGIGLNKSDLSAALLLVDKGQTLKASYMHAINPSHSVAAEMTHRLSTSDNSFTIGSSHVVDPLTLVKTRFSDNGKVGMLCQYEWRPKSLVILSGEYDSKDSKTPYASTPKLGLAIALKP